MIELWELIVLQVFIIIGIMFMVSLWVVRWIMLHWMSRWRIQVWLLELNLFTIIGTVVIVILITLITVVCLLGAKFLLRKCLEFLPWATWRTSATLSRVLSWLSQVR